MSNTVSYIIPYFRDLIKLYPSWDQLHAFLISDKGGCLQITKQTDSLVIIHYNKSISKMEMEHVRWFRSVVWNTVLNRPLSVAPPKAMKEDPSQWVMKDAANKYHYEEYLEGVNMNIYTSAHEEGRPINIATRTRIGASSGFYSSRSFTELLVDAMSSKGVGTSLEALRIALGPEAETAGSCAPIAQFASLLLQHPEHRVVQHITSPNVYRIHYGYIATDGSVMICEDKNDIPSYTPPTDDAITSLNDWFMQIAGTKSWDWQGLIIKDDKGHRWRIRSILYSMIRTLRGATNRTDERFFSLRSQNMIDAYLVYYPEDRVVFEQYEKWVREFTGTLFDLYCKVHKEHTMKMAAIDKKYHVHLTALQTAYMNQTVVEGGKRRPLKKTDVVQYVNTVPTPRLLFVMNYDKRKLKSNNTEDMDVEMN